MGAEGEGMRRLTREHCDQLISIPMAGSVSSLNVSVATGVCLFEIVRTTSCRLKTREKMTALDIKMRQIIVGIFVILKSFSRISWKALKYIMRVQATQALVK